MIVTFTANPSLDRSVCLTEPLTRGQVQRADSSMQQAAGKGINVAAVLADSGMETTAVVAFFDPGFAELLHTQRPRVHLVSPPCNHMVRVNTAITEADGTTTKINEPGPLLSASDIAAGTASVVEQVSDTNASWLVFSGSLPPGDTSDWYAKIIAEVSGSGCLIAVDTSGAGLDRVIDGLTNNPIDLIKPNSDELAQLTGKDAAVFESDAKAGHFEAIVEAALSLHERGIANVLVTLGSAGALLARNDGVWYAQAPKVTVLSTVGAGDSSVAGFILAHQQGADPGRCLATAVAYGSAAASLPGTTLPIPADVSIDQVKVTQLCG